MDELFLDNRIAGLIIKYLQEDITEAEHQELKAWIGSSDRAREIFDELTVAEKLPGEIAHFSESRKRVLEKIHAAEPETRMVVEMNRGFRWKPWLAAAVVIGLAITGYWLVIRDKTEQNGATVVHKSETNDVAPGRDGAILKLADNRSIVLDELKDGEIVKLGSVSISKENGRLIYKNLKVNINNGGLGYNTMSTPKGRTYRVELSDGSIVWLNAASSIHYPVVFGNERRIAVTGEAYLEVAKDPSRRFIVDLNGTSVEVLGTHFNIKSYSDENDIKITLLEGRVKVNSDNSPAIKSAVLKPGQQATITKQAESFQNIKVKTDVDIRQVIAWKDGTFLMINTELTDILKEVERWYDVEILYEDQVTGGFSGEISRTVPVSKLLQILETTKSVHFSINGKKITVMNGSGN